jgi:predicted enzyme related to lactoylglutathione lyase
MFLGLRTLVYHAPDLVAARAFYVKLTGQEPYFEAPYYIGFDINGFELGLDPDVDHIKVGNNQVAYWKVANIAQALEWSLQCGALLEQPATQVGEGTLVAQVIDPWGNYIGLIEEETH